MQKSQRIAAIVVLAFVILAGTLVILNPNRSTADQIDDRLAEHGLVSVLRERFGADYQAALAAVPRDRALTPRQQLSQAIAIVWSIQQKYGEFAGRAPDASLQAVLRARAALLRNIKDVKGPLACANFARRGMPEYYSNRDSVFEYMNAVTIALFTAMADGRDTPVGRRPARQSDLDELAAALDVHGAEDQKLDEPSDAAAEMDCSAAIKTFDEAVALTGAEGERVRSYLVDVIASEPSPTASSE